MLPELCRGSQGGPEGRCSGLLTENVWLQCTEWKSTGATRCSPLRAGGVAFPSRQNSTFLLLYEGPTLRPASTYEASTPARARFVFGPGTPPGRSPSTDFPYPSFPSYREYKTARAHLSEDASFLMHWHQRNNLMSTATLTT